MIMPTDPTTVRTVVDLYCGSPATGVGCPHLRRARGRCAERSRGWWARRRDPRRPGSGEADAAIAPTLRARLHELQEADYAQVVVDLSQVTFVDSTVLGVLVAAHRFCRSLGGELRLVVSEPRVRRLFEITGLTGVFVIHRTLQGALSSV